MSGVSLAYMHYHVISIDPNDDVEPREKPLDLKGTLKAMTTAVIDQTKPRV